MKPLIKPRERVDTAILTVAVLILLMPVIGLLTGTAFSFGYYGSNYQEFSLEDEPESYWFMIKIQLALVGYFVFYSKFHFPLFNAAYQRVLNFKENHKAFAYFLFFVVVPIVVVALLLLMMYMFTN